MSGAAAFDPTAAGPAADRRVAGFAKFRSLGSVLVAAAPSLYLVSQYLFAGGDHPLLQGCVESSTDFCVFWDAARLALDGNGGAVFDQDALHSKADDPDAGWFPWLHPPGTLLLFAPLGAISASLAWAIFTLLSLGCYWAALSLVLGRNRTIWLDMALAPAILPAVILGQFTIFWLAGFIAAFEALRRRKTILAGVLIGLLTLKPTLGLLIPFALLASGAWVTILAAMVTTVVVQGGATLVFGASYWVEMLAIYQEHTVRILDLLPELDRMASLPALLSQIGMTGSSLLTIQTGLTVVLFGTVAWFWRDRSKCFDSRMALLCASIPLATPYLWYYDAALATMSCIYLIRSGILQPTALGKTFYIILWIGPGLLMWMRAIFDGSAIPATYLVLPIMVLGFALSLYRPSSKTGKVLP